MLTKEDIINEIRKLNLPSNEYWIVAGAALVLHGIKEETRDIDVGCTGKLFEMLMLKGYEVKTESDNSRSLDIGGIFSFFENWKVEKIELIQRIPCGSLESIRKHKIKLGREKDLKDIRIIDQFLYKEVSLHNVKGPIEHFSWGKYIIHGKEHGIIDDKEVGCGKDIRITGGEVSSWTERRGHVLDNSMITGVLGNDINILIIGTGVYEKLECPKEVKDYIMSNGIKQIVLKNTPSACSEYNSLFNKGEKVALLAHGTC